MAIPERSRGRVSVIPMAMPIQVFTGKDREAQSELQQLLCGLLNTMTQRLGKRAMPHADAMMQVQLYVAAHSGHTETCKFLVASGADVNKAKIVPRRVEAWPLRARSRRGP